MAPPASRPASSEATRSFSTSEPATRSPIMYAGREWAISVTIWGANAVRNERRSGRPFAPTLSASQSYAT
eukprot:10583430-Alexandrium_andersonii.AAC.1